MKEEHQNPRLPNNLTRRKFLGRAALSGSLLSLGCGQVLGDEPTEAGTGDAASLSTVSGNITEPAREIPVYDEVDVCICGGGPAGVMAAVAAARQGGAVRCVEAHGCLGGIWTSGNLSWLQGHRRKKGLIKKMQDTLVERGVGWPQNHGWGILHGFACDTEEVKLLLEEWCLESGVRPLYHSRVVDGRVQNGRLTHVITENKSGRQAIGAKVFIDATGEGDLATRIGCGFEKGYGPNGFMQPMTLCAIVAGPDVEEIADCVRGPAEQQGLSSKRNLSAEVQKGGYKPSYGPFLAAVGRFAYVMMSNHRDGADGTDAQSVTDHTIAARAEVQKTARALRSLGGRWKDFRIVSTGEQIGVRDGRRIHGLATVTRDDLVEGRNVPDPVCQSYYFADVHSQGRSGVPRTKVTPYQIPYGALVSKDVDGLMMAGRCISGDYIAHSSYRVTGDATTMGEAAGLAAAICAQQNALPKNLDYELLRPHLPDHFDS